MLVLTAIKLSFCFLLKTHLTGFNSVNPSSRHMINVARQDHCVLYLNMNNFLPLHKFKMRPSISESSMRGRCRDATLFMINIQNKDSIRLNWFTLSCKWFVYPGDWWLTVCWIRQQLVMLLFTCQSQAFNITDCVLFICASLRKRSSRWRMHHSANQRAWSRAGANQNPPAGPSTPAEINEREIQRKLTWFVQLYILTPSILQKQKPYGGFIHLQTML